MRQPSFLTCSYAVNTADWVVLVDAGMDSTGADIRALLAAMGHDEHSVRRFFCPIGITAPMPRRRQGDSTAPGCGVYYHIAEEPWLSRKTARAGLRGALAKRIPEWGIGVLLIGLLGEAVPEAVAATEYLSDGNSPSPATSR